MIHLLETQLVKRKEALAEIRRYAHNPSLAIPFGLDWKAVTFVNGYFSESFESMEENHSFNVGCMNRKRTEARGMLQEFAATL